MPKLTTPIHLDMLASGRRARGLWSRVRRAWDALRARGDLYGLEWGDPESSPPLAYVRDHFLLPYLDPAATVLEIGPGGGRWTRYMLGVRELYAVDYHRELLDELRSNFDRPNMIFVNNHGDDFPGIPAGSVDLVFSFGAFVHLDVDIIDRYLRNMKPLLKPSSNAIIQYSDKTKPLGASNPGFSDN